MQFCHKWSESQEALFGDAAYFPPIQLHYKWDHPLDPLDVL